MNCLQLKLQNVQDHIGYDNLANTLEVNLKAYYDWALLCIGGWTEVKTPTSPGAYGGDYTTLRSVSDPSYTDGQVWEAPRKDFVWEDDIDYVNTIGSTINPQQVGTPLSNGSPISTPYYINYPLGQVIFESAVSAPVSLAYSYRNVQISRSTDVPWLRELQFNSHRVDSSQFQQTDTGEWSLFGQSRVQMPCVIIETVPQGTSRGLELGSSAKYASRDVLFHIYSETSSERNNLMDIFNFQTDREIPMFDINTVLEAGEFPLNFQGELINNNAYPDLIEIAGGKRNNCAMSNSRLSYVGQIHPSLYSAVVRTTMTVIV